MARTAQILVLFLFAVCAAQSASSSSSSSGSRRGYGRSHGRHHEPRDYRYSGHRSRHGGDYGRRSGSHAKLHEASAEVSDGSTPLPAFESPEATHEPTIHVGAKLSNGNKDSDSVGVNLPGSSDNNAGAGTIHVTGALPNDNSDNDFPNIGDDVIKSSGTDENPVDSGKTINVDGLKPNNFPFSNPISGASNIDVGGLSPAGVDENPNNGHSIAVDGLMPEDDNRIPKINPGTINVSGKIPNEQGHDNGNINVNGLPENKNKPDKLPNESGDLLNNNEGSITVNGLPGGDNKGYLGGKFGVGNVPSYNNAVKCVQGKCEENPKVGKEAEIRPTEQPITGHNAINVNGISPGDGNNQPSHKVDEDKVVKKSVHPINPHDSFPGLTADKPINVHGLLPGGDGNKPDHSLDINGALTTSGKPNLNNVDGFKPTGDKLDTHNLNNNGLPTGAGIGVHAELPNEKKPVGPIIGTIVPPNFSGDGHNNNHGKTINGRYEYPENPNNGRPSTEPGKVDKKENNKDNKPFLMPVYLPNDNGQIIFPSGVVSQNGKVPAYYVIMINGKATLVKNPAAGLSGSNDGIDIASILGQDGGAGGISIGGLTNLNGNWLQVGDGVSGAGIGLPIMVGSHYPNIGGFKVGNGLPSGSVILNGLLSNGNVPSFITGEQPVNVEPVITEQVPVPQPVITEQIQVPQPIYNIPSPNGPYGYPNMPYPYPWPSMWDNMNSNMNWPNIIEFLINLGAHQKQPHHEGGSIDDNKPKGGNSKTPGGSGEDNKPKIPDDHKPNNGKQTTNPPISGEKIDDEHNKPKQGSGSDNPGSNIRPKTPGNHENGQNPGHEVKPSTKHPIYEKPTERTTLKTTEAPIITKATNPTPHYTKPFETKPTTNPTIYVTNPTQRTPIATKYTTSPVLTKATVAVTHVTAATLHDEFTTNPNGSEEEKKSGQKTTINPGIIQEKIPTDVGNDKGNGLNIPSKPGFTNDESKMTSGPYDPTLINLLNVVLKLPKKSSYIKPKPSEDHESLKKLLESILKPNSGDNSHNLVPNKQPNDEDKILKKLVDLLKSKPENKEFKELLELLKSRPGDKTIKDLLEILKSKPGKKALNELIAILQQKTGGKRHPFHDILGLLNQNDDKNEPNLAIIGQLLLNLLNSYNSQPNMNILVQEPGMDEATRSNLILLLNLLASNLGSEYGLGGAGMGIAGIGNAGLGVTGIGGAGMGVAGVGGTGLGVTGLGGVGMGLGGFEQVNPSNLYFLGQFPCDFSNIRAGVGSQGLERSLWQLLSRMYGSRGNLNSLRLERSAEEGDDMKLKPEN